MNSVPQISHKNVLCIAKTFMRIPTLDLLSVAVYQRKYVYPLVILDQQYLVACCILLSKLLAQVVCFAEKVYVICLIGRLGRAIFRVRTIFAQTSQEGIKCTNGKL